MHVYHGAITNYNIKRTLEIIASVLIISYTVIILIKSILSYNIEIMTTL